MKNLLIIGTSQVGKTTLTKSFAYHFLARGFKEDRIELKPRNSQTRETKYTSIYDINGETESLCLLDTPGPGNGISASIGEDMEQIIDNIVETLIDTSLLHGVVLVTNAITRKDPLFESYLSRLLPVLPDNVKENLYVICTRNIGEFEDEVKKNISKMLGFSLEDKKWFTMDNKCIKSYKSFKEDDLEIFEEYWTTGSQVFRSIYDMVSNSAPLSTSYLNDYQSNKLKMKKLLQGLGFHREELFEKLRERVKTPIVLTKVPSVPVTNKLCHDKNAWSCKDCKQNCCTKNFLTCVFRLLAQIFPISCIFHFRWLSWMFRCSKCRCFLTKHTDNVSLPENEQLIPNRSSMFNEEEPPNVECLVRNHLSGSLKDITHLLSTLKFSSCLHHLYLDDLENVTKSVMDTEPLKSVRVLIIQAVEAEKKLYNDIIRNI